MMRINYYNNKKVNIMKKKSIDTKIREFETFKNIDIFIDGKLYPIESAAIVESSNGDITTVLSAEHCSIRIDTMMSCKGNGTPTIKIYTRDKGVCINE